MVHCELLVFLVDVGPLYHCDCAVEAHDMLWVHYFLHYTCLGMESSFITFKPPIWKTGSTS